MLAMVGLTVRRDVPLVHDRSAPAPAERRHEHRADAPRHRSTSRCSRATRLVVLELPDGPRPRARDHRPHDRLRRLGLRRRVLLGEPPARAERQPEEVVGGRDRRDLRRGRGRRRRRGVVGGPARHVPAAGRPGRGRGASSPRSAISPSRSSSATSGSRTWAASCRVTAACWTGSTPLLFVGAARPSSTLSCSSCSERRPARPDPRIESPFGGRVLFLGAHAGDPRFDGIGRHAGPGRRSAPPRPVQSRRSVRGDEPRAARRARSASSCPRYVALADEEAAVRPSRAAVGHQGRRALRRPRRGGDPRPRLRGGHGAERARGLRRSRPDPRDAAGRQDAGAREQGEPRGRRRARHGSHQGRAGTAHPGRLRARGARAVPAGRAARGRETRDPHRFRRALPRMDQERAREGLGEGGARASRSGRWDRRSRSTPRRS